MATSNTHEQLRLDPGTVKRRRTSGFKCLLCSIGLLCALLGVIFVSRFVSELTRQARSPHPMLYENKTLEEVQDLSKVVRPLVDRDQKFDIFVTVWVRDPGARSFDEPNALDREEHPIFSDVVFRGVTLQDEHVQAKINLSVPLQSFEELNLENHDLRAAFTLVPQSPTLLDHMENYTSWRPMELIFPKIHPENPLFNAQQKYKQSGIESYGMSTPLIDFHPVKSSCVEKIESNSDGDDEAANRDPGQPHQHLRFNVKTTKGKRHFEYHPYVVTRTDLRVARMTNLYNRLQYNTYQTKLKRDMLANGCLVLGESGKDSRECFRTFHMRANAETRFDLSILDERTGENKTQYAYAPYMDVNAYSWGPLDLIPMPVSRELCIDPDSAQAPAPRYLNVTWNVAYSGSAPGKLFLADMLRYKDGFNANDTEYNKARTHQVVANMRMFQLMGRMLRYLTSYLERLHGHKFSNEAHTGRLFILGLIIGAIPFIALNLDIHYWFTRTNTVGISTLGSTSLAVSYMATFLLDIFSLEDGVLSSLTSLVLSLYWNVSIAAVISKTILRLDFLGFEFPCIQLMPASHLERTSYRLETRGRLRLLAAIFACVLIFSIISPLRDYALLPSIGPKPDPLSPHLEFIDRFRTPITVPLSLAGNAFQLILNHRSKTFAGTYKLTAYLLFVNALLELGTYVPWVAGKVELRGNLTVMDVVVLALALPRAVQAFSYPKVPQDIEDKDSD